LKAKLRLWKYFDKLALLLKELYIVPFCRGRFNWKISEWKATMDES